MNKNKILGLIVGSLILFSFPIIAQEESITPEEAQKKLVAVLQKTVPYRFSSDLKVGDKVEYKLKADQENKTDISLEATKKVKNGIWVVEKYDENELHMLIDNDTRELLDFYGIDFKGRKHEPDLVSTNEVIKTYEEITNLSSSVHKMSGIESWENSRINKSINTKFGSMDCQIVQPLFDDKTTQNMKNIDPEERKKMLNSAKQYFSSQVPKMIPFEISTPLISNLNLLESLEGGFVENSVLELKEFNK
ncbi:MAG: hypothetical protein U9P79_00160 [Candidatus Cloacimonadota bacterium]|nr:hypothetical protein [Candidatus Cloacimonadota bacterium]